MNKSNVKFIIICSALTLFFVLNNAHAQTKTAPKIINSGVINGAAISLPKPAYPIAGEKQLRPSGTVNVQVIIDENGNVISAKTVSGVEDIILRKAAEEAALSAKFKPTTLSGKPVKVTGVIVYNFIAELPNEERVKIFGLSLVLHLLKNSVINFELSKEFAGSNEMMNDTINEFPKFSPELKPLAALETLSPQDRFAKIDESLNSIKNKLDVSELWQFEVGKNFAQSMYQFVNLGSGENFDPSKFNENEFKAALLKIKDLSLSAPGNFPKDVLAKLSDLAELGTTDKFFTMENPQLSLENLKLLMQKMEVLFETISPDSTK